ncbi:uncharacterized protein LOC141712372 isoform X2 [Apium graveolens]|uniref:uncharacterized protein LOC141712372 isoform X2 n=1 Tax=Apium graveolens TaxID=4045 RepID=UPI003D7C076F
MDFDEYEYLEKTVVEPDASITNTKGDVVETDKAEKSYRRREKYDIDDDREEDRKSKKYLRDDENGGERKRDERDRDRERDRERKRSRHRSERDEEGESERRRSSRDGDREREREKERDRERRSKDMERERSKERERERSRSRRSRSRSRIERELEREKELIRERERKELRESRKLRDKKEAAELEADPERDQRTVFSYQMPLKATERDVYEFFSKAGKVRDVRLIMDRNSRRSKGVGYIEFYDAMSVPMAIALSGHLLLGQPVMVKPSEAEKNLVQSNASSGGTGGLLGPYGAADRKLYVGNLHFNMTEFQLKQVVLNPVISKQNLTLACQAWYNKDQLLLARYLKLLVLWSLCNYLQTRSQDNAKFLQLEHAKAAQSLNGKLEIAGRTIKVSSVTDHVSAQDTGAKAADFDDDDGGGLALNAQSRALLMQKLDRSGTATSFAGAPVVHGSAPVQQSISVPINGAALPMLPLIAEPIGIPSECLLLKNMFDPATEEDPEFDMDIKDDVHEECSNYGHVKHIHVDKNSAGYVYLRFDTVEGASRAQQAMHRRWFARRSISAIFLQPYEYDAKFKGAVH